MTTLEKKVVELKEQIEKLEKLKVEYEKACIRLSTCNSEIEELELALASARGRRELLWNEVGKQKVFIDNIVSPPKVS